jgi:hypothetical protein
MTVDLNARAINLDATSNIALNAGSITFRHHNNPNLTRHFGNLILDGGNYHNLMGYLFCNRAYIYGLTHISGDLNVLGSKNFIHTHPTDDSKLIRYVAIESSEALTLARGTAKTVNGQVTIELPEHFSLVTSRTEPITVILTPKCAPVVLYAKESSKEKIVVAMKPSDFSEFKDSEFSFQVTGVRDGFEKQEVIVDADKLDSSSTIREDVQKRIDAYVERTKKAQRELRHQDKE